MPSLASPESEQHVYNSDDEIAQLEHGMQEPAAGNTLASDDPEQEAQNLQNAFDAPAFGDKQSAAGGFVSGGIDKLKSELNTRTGYKKKIGMYAGVIVGCLVGFILLIIFTFNIPTATVRAAGTGLISSYFGAQIAQGKLHFTNYWNGKIADGYMQSCVSGNCEVTNKKTLLEKFGIRSTNQDLATLKSKGITLISESGKFTGIRIDASDKNSPYWLEDARTIQTDLEKKSGFKLNVDKLTNDSYGLGDVYNVKTNSKFTGFRNNALVGSVMEYAGHNSDFSKWGAVRNMSGILGLGFKPLMSARSKVADKVNGTVDEWMKSLLDKIGGKGPTELSVTGKAQTDPNSSTTTDSSGKLSYDNIKTELAKVMDTKGVKGAGGAMVIAGGVCMWASVVNGANAVSAQNFNAPAGRLGMTLTSASDTVNANAKPDIDSSSVNAFVTTFLERKAANGTINSFSDSAAWKHQNGINGGVQMQTDHALAAGVINSNTQAVKSSSTLNDIAVQAGKICGDPIISGTMAVGGIVLTVLSGPFAILEGALIAGVAYVGTNAAISMMSGSPLDLTQLVKDPAETYNVSAAGTKNLADQVLFAHGGDPQSSTDYNKYRTAYLEDQSREFQSQSLAYRLFNMQDPLSVASKIAVKGSAYPASNIASLGSSFVNMLPNIGHSFASSLFPKAMADSYVFDPCAESTHKCTGLSEQVMRDDASKAITFLGTDPDVSEPHLQYMKDCRDDEFYKDNTGTWTFRIVDGTPANTNRLTGQLDAKCNDSKNLNDPLIISLKSYTNLQPMLAGKVCMGAGSASTNETDKTACTEVGYGDPSAGTASSSASTNQSGDTTFRFPVEDAVAKTLTVTNCYSSTHAGLDFPIPTGTNVLAVMDGTVVSETTFDPKTGKPDTGNGLLIKLVDGHFVSYQHLSQKNVHTGSKVTKGQVIGLSGATGYVFGAHLHLTIASTQTWGSRTNTSLTLNPLQFLPKTGITYACH